MGNISDDFDREEFACKCCGLYNMDEGVIARLQMARDFLKMPLKINSGSRCPAHNVEEGGSETSSHLKGLAVDVAAIGDSTRWKVVMALLSAGFTRIGIGKTFIHVDSDYEKTDRVIWVY